MIAPVLADWATSLDIAELPASATDAALAATLDTVGNLVCGAEWSHAPVEHDGPPSELAGTLASCARYCETDDVFLGAGGHPGAVVIGAILALARSERRDGAGFLRAIIAGYEVM
jgi:2-methylcitrate dehydratase PrpD